MARFRLPNRRISERSTLTYGNQGVPVEVTIGFYDDAMIGEVFLDVTGKAGSQFSSAARDIGLLVSFCLQYGAPIDDLAKAVTRTPDGRPDSLAGAVLDLLVERAAQ